MSVNPRSWSSHWSKSVLVHTAFSLVAFALLVPLPVRASEDSYTVKRGDTVYSIARSHGISIDTLADRNGLSRNYQSTPASVW